MAKILIAGYHGFGNCGDEAILLAMKNNIKALYSSASLSVLSFRPAETEAIYGIKSINRFKPFDVLRAIIKTDVLISGGGSLLQDETSVRSLMYYLGIILTAKLLGKKVMLYSNGIGPVSKRISKILIKLVINRVDLITLRECSSLEELKGMGVTRPPSYVTADPAFTLSGCGTERAFKLLEEEGIKTDAAFAGISIRPWKGCECFISDIASLCDYIAETYGVNILFIPMQRGVDTKISEEIMSKMKKDAYILKGKYGSDEILGVIGTLEVMLSMRLHSLIFAAVQNVPMLGFIYDPKVRSFLDLINMPEAGDIHKLDLDAVKEKVDNLFQNNKSIRETMKIKTDELKLAAKQNEQLLRKMF